jgi:hypothetical protein
MKPALPVITILSGADCKATLRPRQSIKETGKPALNAKGSKRKNNNKTLSFLKNKQTPLTYFNATIYHFTLQLKHKTFFCLK